jgi:predicted tellurium resistance membrane protein TerC
MDFAFTPEMLASLLTLTALEIVLGIDNIIFLSIISSRLPKKQQPLARKLGLAIALGGRIVFLFSISVIMRMTEPVMTVFNMDFSWRDIILLAGGLFLIYKSTKEMHHSIEGDEDEGTKGKQLSFTSAIVQISILDIVFALDSMITAVGLSNHLWIMITANVIAMGIMLAASEPVSKFIEQHPTLKMLALSFLLMVGIALVADGTHVHIPRNYIYFSLAFSSAVEFLNILTVTRRKKKAGKKGHKA